MSFVDRLAGIGTNEGGKIPVDTFWSTLYELSAGRMTQAGIISYFALDAGEQAELTWLIGKYNAQPNATAKAKFVELMRVFFILAEAEVPGYQTEQDLVAKINSL